MTYLMTTVPLCLPLRSPYRDDTIEYEMTAHTWDRQVPAGVVSLKINDTYLKAYGRE